MLQIVALVAVVQGATLLARGRCSYNPKCYGLKWSRRNGEIGQHVESLSELRLGVANPSLFYGLAKLHLTLLLPSQCAAIPDFGHLYPTTNQTAWPPSTRFSVGSQECS